MLGKSNKNPQLILQLGAIPTIEATGNAKMQVSFDDLSSQVHVPDTWPQVFAWHFFLGDLGLPETDESPFFLVLWA